MFQPNASSSSGGGGGSALVWSEQANSPTYAQENNYDVYQYSAGLAQDLFTAIKVPNSYSAGSPINVRVAIYSPDSSGNMLVRAQATLIRTGTDAITSTTNQRTTTNSAISCGAGTVNIPQAVALDVSDTTGHVNSVVINAGDIILVRMYRDTDTATSDVRFVVQSSEVTFT